VDRSLTGFFRKNRQFGSNDRRRISATIFGYYRWYGWLKQISSERLSLALLLGYLLDNNEISPFVSEWGDSLGLPATRLLEFNQLNLGAKSQLIGEYIENNSPDFLNPHFLNLQNKQLVEFNQLRAPTWVRVQAWAMGKFKEFLKLKGIQSEQSPLLSDAIQIKNPVNLFECKEFKLGGIEVQDISSQIVGLICAPQPEDIWWDVCAGSGGKALHLAALTGGKGKIFATDIRKHSVVECKRRVLQGSWRNIETLIWDGIEIPAFSALPNKVLIDAPCSCSGIWRRSPDLRWSLTRDRISEFTALQLEILAKTAPLVPENGSLFYVTCSILPEENERVVEKFLTSHPEFRLSAGDGSWGKRQGDNIGIYLGPPEVDGNFMFVSQMIRNQNSG
jgi:16S rRNA (cytosine967-C5)-methyltransferase